MFIDWKKKRRNWVTSLRLVTKRRGCQLTLFFMDIRITSNDVPHASQQFQMCLCSRKTKFPLPSWGSIFAPHSHWQIHPMYCNSQTDIHIALSWILQNATDKIVSHESCHSHTLSLQLWTHCKNMAIFVPLPTNVIKSYRYIFRCVISKSTTDFPSPPPLPPPRHRLSPLRKDDISTMKHDFIAKDVCVEHTFTPWKWWRSLLRGWRGRTRNPISRNESSSSS